MKHSIFAILLLFTAYIGQSQEILLSPQNTSHQNFVAFVNTHPEYSIFRLLPGTFTPSGESCITRNNIIIRKEYPASEVRISRGIQICGNGNFIDGLTWYGDINTFSSDPGTLAISGSNNTIRSCRFINFKSATSASFILRIGRKKSNACFSFSQANNNTVEFCVFDGWGKLNGSPSTEASGCIVIGHPDVDCNGTCGGNFDCPIPFTGTIIRNNEFKNGPYKQYGFNSAIKVYHPVSNVLIEGNIIDSANEVLEIKANDIVVRGNKIIHASGYNVLANRSGKNNVFEGNYVANVEPITNASSSQGFMIWQGGNTIFRNNIFVNCRTLGLILGKEILAHEQLRDVLITNNTFVNFGEGIRYESGSSSFPAEEGLPANINITNNIFFGNSNNGPINALNYFSPSSLGLVSTNLFYNNVNPAGTNFMMADPLFAQVSNNDFHLTSASPAIDKSCNFPGLPFLDYDNLIRPVDGDGNGSRIVDLGAYEFTNASNSVVFCSDQESIALANRSLNETYIDKYRITAYGNVSVADGNYSLWKYIYEASISGNFDAPQGARFDIEPSSCTHIQRAYLYFDPGALKAGNDWPSTENNSSINNEASIYPNPNNGSFSISLQGKTAKDVSIYDSNGRLVAYKKLSNIGMKVYEKFYFPKSGVYLVRIGTAEGYLAKKVVIQ
jgi:hypothetical protein